MVNGVHYRVWAPRSERVLVRITPIDGVMRIMPLEREPNGYHSGYGCRGRVRGTAIFSELAPGRRFPVPRPGIRPRKSRDRRK